MGVRIIQKTAGVNELLGKTLEEMVAYIARVSSSRKNKTAEHERLLKYLIDSEHWSPFEHYYFTLEIETTLAISVQLLRHRSFTFQQKSRRYNGDTIDVMPLPALRLKANGGNRQGSSLEMANDDIHIELEEVLTKVIGFYNKLIEEGVAPECARMVLPQCTPTLLHMTGNIRSWIHFLKIRTDKNAQLEMQDLAYGIRSVLAEESNLFTYL